MSATRTGAIGRDVERRANRALLTGAARFVADVRRDGELHARIVRSSIAHGRIAGIETAAAAALPGVVAVLTADDLPDVRIPIRLPFAETPETDHLLQPPLARDVVRYVGEPVAVVVATDPYVAEDAAELVWVECEELPPVVELATAPGAAPLHPGHDSNVVNAIPLRHGDVDAAFAKAAVVVRDTLRMHRHTAVPMETRGLVAELDERSGVLTVWGAAKVKHFTRQVIADALGLAPERVRLVETSVGGGFGVRGEPYPEDILVAHLALRLRRPVKWIEDRAEHFVATNHAREQEHELELAMVADGTLLAFRARTLCDQGAYVRSQGTLPSLLPAIHLPGPYRWEAFELVTHGVLTNRTPVGTYRGPGMTEATFVRERMVDRAAAELGIDPADARRRSLVPPAAIPFRLALAEGSAPVPPIAYESGDFPASLELLLERAGYDELRRRRDDRRARGELAGVGLGAYVEVGAIGPFEQAIVHGTADGRFHVQVGAGSLGQGVETALAQIAADGLGVEPALIDVDFHDTDAVPLGFGAFASRSTTLCGNAIARATAALRERAAAALGVAPAEVAFAGGSAHAGAGRALPVADLGEASGRFEKAHPSFSFGAVLAAVAVDEGTGRVTVERLVVLHDVGRAVNPALLRGQLVGAAAQGVGGALLEELAYDENGQPLSTSFADYLMPTASELPEIEPIVVEHPTPANPLGVKGGGEAGMVGVPAAIANAVADALSPRGVVVARLPLTPDRVRALLRGDAR